MKKIEIPYLDDEVKDVDKFVLMTFEFVIKKLNEIINKINKQQRAIDRLYSKENKK